MTRRASPALAMPRPPYLDRCAGTATCAASVISNCVMQRQTSLYSEAAVQGWISPLCRARGAWYRWTMKRIALAFALLSACAPSAPTPMSATTPAEMAATRQIISANLKDPGSLEMRSVRTYRHATMGPVVCGEFNARNAMGGYSGFEAFSATLNDRQFETGILGGMKCGALHGGQWLES